jgi:hypothetical protein
MTTNKDKTGRYTVIDDDHTFIVVDKPKAFAAKILREHVSAIRADQILSQENPPENEYRKAFIAAAAKQRNKT